MLSQLFSEKLKRTLNAYNNRAIATQEVIDELIAMGKEFRDAMNRGEELGLLEDEVAFYDALAANESAVMLISDAQLKVVTMKHVGGAKDIAAAGDNELVDICEIELGSYGALEVNVFSRGAFGYYLDGYCQRRVNNVKSFSRSCDRRQPESVRGYSEAPDGLQKGA